MKRRAPSAASISSASSGAARSARSSAADRAVVVAVIYLPTLSNHRLDIRCGPAGGTISRLRILPVVGLLFGCAAQPGSGRRREKGDEVGDDEESADHGRGELARAVAVTQVCDDG